MNTSKIKITFSFFLIATIVFFSCRKVDSVSPIENSIALGDGSVDVSWTFDKTECFTSNHIGVAISRPGVVSGLISNRYNCDGATHY